MMRVVFISLLIMTVLAEKEKHNAPIKTKDYSQYDKSSKKYSKEFSKNITDKINKNHLLMSHILLRQSLTGNRTESDFLNKNLTKGGQDDFLRKIIMATSNQENDGHESSKPNRGNIYLGGRKNLNNEDPNQKPVFLPIIMQRPIPLPMPHLFPINYPFGGAMMFQGPPLNFMIPTNIAQTCPKKH